MNNAQKKVIAPKQLKISINDDEDDDEDERDDLEDNEDDKEK